METGCPEAKSLPPPPSRNNFCEIISVVLSGVALIVSAVAIHVGLQAGRDAAQIELIAEQYKSCYDLDRWRAEFPEVGHIFALPQWYGQVSAEVAALASAKKVPKEEFLLRERAAALLVFDIYEQTLYQWGQAARAGDGRRVEFLTMYLDYYEKKLLRNPRLRQLWDEGWSDIMENDTKDRYKLRVAKEAPGKAACPLDGAPQAGSPPGR